MCKFFYDTEFYEDGRTIMPISIGIVRETLVDGDPVVDDFYRVVNWVDHTEAYSIDWLRKNVYNSIGHALITDSGSLRLSINDRNRVDSIEQMRRDLNQFVSCRCQVPNDSEDYNKWRRDNSELWAYFASYDYVVLSQLYGRMLDLPSRVPMFTMDLKQIMYLNGIDRDELPKQESGEHNALADAKWNYEVYKWFKTEKGLSL